MTQVYLAGPLFSVAEQEFNRSLARLLEQGLSLSIILPQVRALQFSKDPNRDQLVFADCLAMIDASDLVVAILEGADADSGTCVELGYAYARGKPIVGLRTDFRPSEHQGVNLMVSHLCVAIVGAGCDSIEGVANELVGALQRALSFLVNPPAGSEHT